MIVLVLGMLLWVSAHFFKRVLPTQRAEMGSAGKGLVTFGILAGLVLIILGYSGVEIIDVWYPPTWTTHVNNLLMLLAFWTFGSSAAKRGKVWPASRTRHPQLLAVKIWAVAHLITNGDLASIILFGGMLAWAVAEVILINRAEPDWTPPPPADRPTLIRLIVITVVVFVVVSGIHYALGVSPFPN